jgi:SNF2 family DNA or RNA helicase
MRSRCDIRSYDFFARTKNKLELKRYTAAVVDESTYIKTWTAKRTIIICSLILPIIPKVIFLSASPLQKSAGDLHPTLSIIDETIPDFHTFEEKYCNQVYDVFKGIIYTGVNLLAADELKEIWSKHSIKFTKQDVASELPPIVEEVVYFKPDKAPAYDPATLDYDHVTAEMKTEYQVIGMQKVPYVMDFIENSQQEPTLIFCHHRRVNDELTAALQKAGYRVGQILGGDAKKDEKVVAFQEGRLGYLVISMEAGGTGLNLPRASRVLYAELPWTYVTYYQTMNRAHRLTTQHTVYVHTFVLSGTLDIGLLRTIQEKRGFSEAIVGEIDNTINKEDHGKTKENTRTTDKTKSDSYTRNLGNTSGASSLEQLASECTSRKSNRDGNGNGRPSSETRTRSDSTRSSTTNSTGRYTSGFDDLGLSIDDLGLSIQHSNTSGSDSDTRQGGGQGNKEPFGQRTCNPSTECSDFLDELCRTASVSQGLSSQF